jgi:predicted Zn-dependent peptidase
MQLHMAKQQLMGQIAMAEESKLSLMLMLGKSLLDREKVETMTEVFAQVEAISAQDISEVANERLAENQLSTLVFSPE